MNTASPAGWGIPQNVSEHVSPLIVLAVHIKEEPTLIHLDGSLFHDYFYLWATNRYSIAAISVLVALVAGRKVPSGKPRTKPAMPAVLTPSFAQAGMAPTSYYVHSTPFDFSGNRYHRQYAPTSLSTLYLENVARLFQFYHALPETLRRFMLISG